METAKKQYRIEKPYGTIEITTSRFSDRLNGTLSTEWQISFAGKTSLFSQHDITTTSTGLPAIKLYGMSEIAVTITAAARVEAKKNLYITIPDDILSALREEHESNLLALQKLAADKPVSKFIWAIGGDSHRILMFTDDITSEEQQVRPDIQHLCNAAEELDQNVLRAVSTPIERDTPGLYLLGGWYEVSAVDLQRLVAEVEIAAHARESAAERREQEKWAAAFENARKTGKPQAFASWMADCNDPHEECSQDNITLWAMPDGTKKQTRQHTW